MGGHIATVFRNQRKTGSRVSPSSSKACLKGPSSGQGLLLTGFTASKITPNNYQLETKCSNTGTLEGHLTLKPQAPTCVYTWTHATKNLKID